MAKKKTAQKVEHALAEKDGGISVPSDYPQLLAALKSRIQTARVQAHLAVNRELVRLYWDIGRVIVERQQLEGWGKSVVERLSADLSSEFPEMKGLSTRNLWLMRQMYLAYQEHLINMQQPAAYLSNPSEVGATKANLAHAMRELLQQAAAEFQGGQPPQALLEIPWFHNVVLVEKLKDPALRLWYAAQTTEHGWSRAVLVHQIESELHLRATSQTNNFATTLTDPQSDLARELIKDSYNLEFLDVRESIHERELEESLITHLRDFLLELGTGFAFIGNQYRLEVGDQEYLLDLLFYHTRLHCHVVVELKIEAFKPEHAGKMQFYLAAVDDLLKSERDAPTIGILLCKEKNKVVVEYALRDSSKPIAVSDYKLNKTLPEELKDELPSVAELKEQLKRHKKSQ